MKKYIKTILVTVVALFAVVSVVWAANTFPTTLNNYSDGDIIPSDWADALESKIGVTGSSVTSSLDYRVSRMASLSEDETVTGFWTFSASPRGFIVNNSASVSVNFEIAGYASISKFSLLDSSTGATIVDCDADSQALGYDLTNQRFFCGDDDGGNVATSYTIDMRDGYSGAYTNIGSISYNTAHFGLNIGQTIASLSLDWGDGGPASLSQAETITGNWVNTTNPWADNEVIDTISVIGGIIGANSISGTQTTTGTLTIGDNGDSIIFDASNWDISTLGKADFLSASVSTNFEAITYASAQFYLGTAFSSVGDCNDDGEAIGWTTTGIFICNTLADADIPDALTIDTGSTLNTLSIGSGVTWTTTGTLTIGDNGDAVNFNTSTWDVTAGAFTGVAGMIGTGVYDFGGATSFEIPNGTPTLDTTGEIGGTTASTQAFFGHFDGVTAKAVHDPCFTYIVDSPTAANPGKVTGKRFNDPFTLTSVQPVASGTNAAGWNLRYGVPGTVTTSVFTTNRSASTSTYPTYTSFTNSVIGDGNVLEVHITSRSAVLQTFAVTVCGYYPR
jgi:hypothetical protein